MMSKAYPKSLLKSETNLTGIEYFQTKEIDFLRSYNTASHNTDKCVSDNNPELQDLDVQCALSIKYYFIYPVEFFFVNLYSEMFNLEEEQIFDVVIIKSM